MQLLRMLTVLLSSLTVSGKEPNAPAPSPSSTYATMITLLNDTLKPYVLAEHHTAQLSLAALIANFGACNKSSESSAHSAALTSKTEDRNAHDTCRNEQQPITANATHCRQVLTGLHSAMVSACNLVNTLQQEPAAAADDCHASGNPSYINWVEDNLAHFDGLLTALEDAIGACTNRTNEHDDKQSECEAMEATEDAKKALCNQTQRTFENSVCELAAAREALCDNTCYGNALTTYNAEKNILMVAEASRKITWRVLMRMECLLTIISADETEASDIEECRARTYNTTHLDLEWVPVPSPVSCPTDVIEVPCTTEFTSKYYAPLPVAVGECMACSSGSSPTMGPEMQLDGILSATFRNLGVGTSLEDVVVLGATFFDRVGRYAVLPFKSDYHNADWVLCGKDGPFYKTATVHLHQDSPGQEIKAKVSSGNWMYMSGECTSSTANQVAKFGNTYTPVSSYLADGSGVENLRYQLMA